MLIQTYQFAETVRLDRSQLGDLIRADDAQVLNSQPLGGEELFGRKRGMIVDFT